MSETSLFSFLIALGIVCLVVLTIVIASVGYQFSIVLRQVRQSLPELKGAVYEARTTLKRLKKISKRGTRMSKTMEDTVLAVCTGVLDIAGGFRNVNEIAQTFIEGRIGNGHRSGRARTRKKKQP